jgi:hypothetical protein
MSQPALKAITRLPLKRVATPAPRTISRLDALAAALAEADVRVEYAWTLLWRDAQKVEQLDWPAFASRVQALLHDLETTTELITAMIPLSGAAECTLRDRARMVGERRVQLQRWLKQIGQR